MTAPVASAALRATGSTTRSMATRKAASASVQGTSRPNGLGTAVSSDVKSVASSATTAASNAGGKVTSLATGGGSPTIILIAGLITIANEFANGKFQEGSPVKDMVKIPLATGVMMVVFAGVDKISPALGKILAVTALITIFITDFKGDSPASNLIKLGRKYGIGE